MRTTLYLAAAVLSLGLANLSASAQEGAAVAQEKGVADKDKAIAERVFGNADKNKDGALEGKELLEAKRIFRSAILQGKKPTEIPGGKLTVDRIADAASKGKLEENKAVKVTKEEWLDHAKDAFAKRDGIVKEVIDKANAEYKERAERVRKERG